MSQGDYSRNDDDHFRGQNYQEFPQRSRTFNFDRQPNSTLIMALVNNLQINLNSNSSNIYGQMFREEDQMENQQQSNQPNMEQKCIQQVNNSLMNATKKENNPSQLTKYKKNSRKSLPEPIKKNKIKKVKQGKKLKRERKQSNKNQQIQKPTKRGRRGGRKRIFTQIQSDNCDESEHVNSQKEIGKTTGINRETTELKYQTFIENVEKSRHEQVENQKQQQQKKKQKKNLKKITKQVYDYVLKNQSAYFKQLLKIPSFKDLLNIGDDQNYQQNPIYNNLKRRIYDVVNVLAASNIFHKQKIQKRQGRVKNININVNKNKNKIKNKNKNNKRKNDDGSIKISIHPQHIFVLKSQNEYKQKIAKKTQEKQLKMRQKRQKLQQYSQLKAIAKQLMERNQQLNATGIDKVCKLRLPFEAIDCYKPQIHFVKQNDMNYICHLNGQQIKRHNFYESLGKLNVNKHQDTRGHKLVPEWAMGGAGAQNHCLSKENQNPDTQQYQY